MVDLVYRRIAADETYGWVNGSRDPTTTTTRGVTDGKRFTKTRLMQRVGPSLGTTGDVATAVSSLVAKPAAVKVIAEALALSDEERASVAEELLASSDPTPSDDSPEAVAAFKAALDQRWAAYQAGEEPGIPWPDVRARLRARLNRG